jgi:hypothetical protein
VSQYPSRHPYPRPNQQTAPYDPVGDRAFAAEWLGHLAAGRVGGNPPMSEERVAAILANERVVMGPRWRAGE